MNILIADDDATSRLVLSATLKKLGHQVTATKSGAEALAVFDAINVPLLISDMVMKDVDGLELCRRVRALDRTRYTYIILLTSVGGKSGYLVGMRAGADDFINKPFDEELLSARLVVAERILGVQSQLRQLSGLIPICAQCKKVRDDQNYWHQVERYVAQRTDAKFSHGYCPDCLKQALTELENQADAKPGAPVAEAGVLK